MPPENLEEQLTKYLTDAHSIEEQALVQMRGAPKLAGDEALAQAFRTHETETEHHEQLVRGRLEALGAKPSTLKDIAGAVTGQGFALFAAVQPDTPGKLVTHAYSYEHMELAAYDLLSEVADQAGDSETARVAREIREQERAMAERLAGLFDTALEASLKDHPRDDLKKLLVGYLTDAHALESQSEQLLSKGPDLAGSSELARVFEEHLEETREHLKLVEDRLNALGESPSKLKDAALRLGALNWGGFFGAQPDTPAKLAGFAYAVEHLEVGAYELLRRIAARAGDGETEAMAERILGEEREAGEKVHAQFPNALAASLEAQGVSG